MDNPHPTVFARLAQDAVGSVVAATAATGALGAGALALGIAGGSPFLAVLGVLLLALAAAWTWRGWRRASTARRMRARSGDEPGAVHLPTE